MSKPEHLDLTRLEWCADCEARTEQYTIDFPVNPPRNYIPAWVCRGCGRKVDYLKLYYLQQSNTFNHNDVVWWRDRGSGYTSLLTDAGKFTREEAIDIIDNNDAVVAYPCDYVEGLVHSSVDATKLRVKEAAEFSAKNIPEHLLKSDV